MIKMMVSDKKCILYHVSQFFYFGFFLDSGMTGGLSGGGPSVTLIRASWLRAKQPRFLPSAKSDLPPEALIYASELRKIYRQTKTKQKLLPIISVLHPLSAPMSAEAESHPDNDGTILGRVIEALDMRWDQFTRKRGTGAKPIYNSIRATSSRTRQVELDLSRA